MHVQERLLPRQEVITTNSLDKGDWSYSRGPLGWVSRARFALVIRALDRWVPPHASAALEIGYGSGLFLPALSQYADEVHGADVHPHAEEVARALEHRGIRAHLVQCPAEHLALEDSSVDVVVAISCLEFLDDLDAMAREVARVLKPGGYAITVTPGQSWLLDKALKVLTGERGEDTFQGRRGLGVLALGRVLEPVESTVFPPHVPAGLLRMYTCSVFTKPRG